MCYRNGFNMRESSTAGRTRSSYDRRLASAASSQADHVAHGFQGSSPDAKPFSTGLKVDKTCPDFFVFVGSRGSLFQVCLPLRLLN